MKNCLKIALDYKKKKMLPTDVDEEVLLDDMTNREAMEMYLALTAVYGCKSISKCVKFYKGKYIALDFSGIFEYAMDGAEYSFQDIDEMFKDLISSDEFQDLLNDPVFIIN